MTPMLAVASLLSAQQAPRELGAPHNAATMQQNGAARAKASQLIGCAITNSEQQKLGAIQDIVLDGRNHQIAYAVVGYGGFLGLGEKYFAMPWSVFTIEPNGTDRGPAVRLDLDAETLTAAPGFDKGKWPDMANASWAKHVDEYYAAHDAEPTQPAKPAPKGSAPDGTSGVDRPPTSPKFVHRRLSRMIGMRVVDPQHAALADVEDLVVDLHAATVDGVLLSFGGVLGIGESLALVPASALTLDVERQAFVFPCTPKQLAAMALPDGKWPALQNDAWLTTGRALCAKARAAQAATSGDVILIDASGRKPVPFADSYDVDDVETIEGTITTIGSVRVGDRDEQRVRLRVLIEDGREVIVHAAPATFEDQQMLGLHAGTAVEITGSPARYGSQTVLVAGSIKVDGKTARLRDDKGAVTWAHE